MPEENPLDLIRKRPVVLRLPEMEAVTVRRDVEYLAAPGEPRTLDLYLPAHQESRSGMPAVVFVMGYPDAGMKAMMGCRAKEIGQYTSWARLVAASGMIGVTYSAQDQASETLAVFRWLRENARSLNLDASRLGVWSCSGNVPNAMGVLMSEEAKSIRCAVLCYGLTLDLDGSTFVAEASKLFRFVTPAAGRSVADLPQELPQFIARAGNDEIAHLNDTIDAFVAAALAHDLPITVVNHRGAPHAFDAILDDEPTRELIRRMLAFLRFHLAS